MPFERSKPMKLFGNTSYKNKADIKKADMKKEKKGLKTFLIIAAAVVLVCAAVYAALHIFYVKPPEISNDGSEVSVKTNSNRKDNFFTFVLCGTDEGDSRTDTIMVVAFDVANKKVNIVSVPRDTILNVTWNVKKINSAYSYDGIEGLKDALKSVLGFNMDFYAEVNLKAFKDLVDEIGGVDFDVPEDMYYEDPTQDLIIDLDEGPQKLSGEKAMELIRYRQYAMGDIKRVSVQQDFMKALFKQLLKIGNVTKVSQLAEIFSENMNTDLSTGNLIWFGERLLSVKSEDIKTFTLPGGAGSYEGLSYWHLDAKQVLEMVNQYLNPYKKDVTTKDLDIVNGLSGTLVSSTGKKVLDPTPEAVNDEPEETPPVPSATVQPSPSASASPSPSPTTSPMPSPSATVKPTTTPSPTKTPTPSPAPTPTPSASPSATPSTVPTPSPSSSPAA